MNQLRLLLDNNRYPLAAGLAALGSILGLSVSWAAAIPAFVLAIAAVVAQLVIGPMGIIDYYAAAGDHKQIVKHLKTVNRPNLLPPRYRALSAQYLK